MDRHPDTAGGQAPLRALVVDDEAPLVGLVTRYLEREGFQVRAAGDGLHAVELARTFQPEVIVLDLMLPRLDGIEACRQIRTFSDAYVVMLTARTEEVDKLVGLGVGADDYLTKPFSPRELVARIRAMLRRPRATAPMPADAGPVRRIGELVIDPAAREVQLAGEPVELTRLEFDLLEALSERPRVVLSRRQLLERVWGADWYGDAGRVRGSLGAKLLLAQMLVVIAGSLTLAVVALAVAPGVFHTHVRMALGVVPPETARHLDEGLAKAITVALGTGTGVAVATALGVSFLLARRITSPIRSLDQAAGRVARATTPPVSPCPPAATSWPGWPLRSTPWPRRWKLPNSAEPNCSPTWPMSCAPRWPPSTATLRGSPMRSSPPTTRSCRSCRPKRPACDGWSMTSTPSPARKSASSTCTRSAATPTSCSPPRSRRAKPPMPPKRSP